jgi:hypothetical protein
VVATPTGTPFFISRLAIGIIAHSHIGKKIPIADAISIAKILFLGNIFAIVFSETYSCIKEDIKEPRNIKGIASSIMLINMAEKFLRVLPLKVTLNFSINNIVSIINGMNASFDRILM